MMFWNSDQTTVEKSVFHQRLEKTLEKSQWILDGNYASTMELRMQACDTVVFLDYPLEVCLDGIEQRKGKPRSDMPWVEPNKPDEEFIEFIKNYHSQSRPKVLQLLTKYAHKNIFVFENRRDADVFLTRMKQGINEL
jgi:adenylate kinase family enzyme